MLNYQYKIIKHAFNVSDIEGKETLTPTNILFVNENAWSTVFEYFGPVFLSWNNSLCCFYRNVSFFLCAILPHRKHYIPSYSFTKKLVSFYLCNFGYSSLREAIIRTDLFAIGFSYTQLHRIQKNIYIYLR